MKKLLVAMIASAFALGAYAQTPKAEPKAPAATTAQPKMETEKKAAKVKTAKAGKTSKKAAKKEVQKDSK